MVSEGLACDLSKNAATEYHHWAVIPRAVSIMTYSGKEMMHPALDVQKRRNPKISYISPIAAPGSDARCASWVLILNVSRIPRSRISTWLSRPRTDPAR